MIKLSSRTSLIIIGSAAALAASCSKSPGSGTPGNGDAAVSDNVLLPSATGFIDGTNKFGIIGAWYAYGDNYATDGTAGMGDCEEGSGATPTPTGLTPAQCSQFAAPTPSTAFAVPVPGQPFPPTDVTTGKMCAAGTVAQVVDDTVASPDYSDIFGLGIGFDFNNRGTADGGTADGGPAGKQPFDLTAAGITGFSFDIDTPPLNALRVEFPTTASGNNSAYLDGTLNTSTVKAGTNSFKIANITGPMYAMNPPMFDPTIVLSMQFHVVASTTSTTPFQFCISNVTMLTN